MKLDLLYEIDCPKPWPGPHPLGQRQAEQQSYREALEQIRLADQLGFHTTWHVEHHFREGRSHCPAPEVVLGALSQITEQIRLGFGVTLLPHAFGPPMRVAEKVATVDILSDGRVEWGTGRSTPMEQTAFGVDREQQQGPGSRGDRGHRRHVGIGVLRVPRQVPGLPTAHGDAQAGPGPSPAGLDGRHQRWQRRHGRRDGSRAPVLRHHAAARADGGADRAVPGGQRPGARPSPGCTTTASRPTRWSTVPTTMAQCEADGIWESVWWWYKNLAEFTIEWELPHLSQERAGPGLPPPAAADRGRLRSPRVLRRRHDHRRATPTSASRRCCTTRPSASTS